MRSGMSATDPNDPNRRAHDQAWTRWIELLKTNR
jgi:hypothetical protein